jgi:hypothetical protein
MDWKKPTVQMLGRWQPWHKGHTELFKRAHAKTGQVCIMVRDVFGSSGGDGQDDNPFAFNNILFNIIESKWIIVLSISTRRSKYISYHYTYLSSFSMGSFEELSMSFMPWLPSTQHLYCWLFPVYLTFLS